MIVYFDDQVYLKGERIISTLKVRVPKSEVPILAAMKKKIVTDIIDVKINIHDGGSNSFKRFQKATLAGYLENSTTVQRSLMVPAILCQLGHPQLWYQVFLLAPRWFFMA